ncbi:DNA-formamidopyrimidine glycosylase family protein [Nocardia sp. NPDC020380]|uniref:DNA-formamidopyrimidine glycosylase family protein n=1 Tax=Nocardia sp. NPDC020380 TaxID=3364309 RepID=UPI0037A9E781
MPEGDSVFLTAARLRKALAGRVLDRSDFRVPKYATLDLRGQEVESVGTYGKHLFVRTPSVSIHTHLKMEGEWRVYQPGQRWTKPGFAARLVLANAEAEAVGFSLGLVEVLRPEDEHTAVEHLGPDLLGPNWDAAEAVRRLLERPDRPIGLALLDQRNLAGIGNIYRSEICYLRRVNPAMSVGAIEDLPGLVDEAHKVLLKAAHQPPWRALAYGRQHRPCKRCGANMVVHLLGDDEPTRAERGIYFCPRCQPPVD